MEERVDRRLCVFPRPPDELQGNTVEGPGYAPRRRRLVAPRVELFQTGSPSVLEAGSQLHRLRRDDEHLYVGDVIGVAANHAAHIGPAERLVQVQAAPDQLR